MITRSGFFLLRCVGIFAIFTVCAGEYPRSHPEEYLAKVHARLKISGGSFQDEYPEQLMVAMYLPEDAKVLELGGNIGRNTLVIASILSDSKNLVSMETAFDSARRLLYNQRINHLDFHIENAALSKVALIQSGWTTIPSEVVLPGYFKVRTITFDELCSKYGITFDTLVIDCEGAFYGILKDEPSILDSIKLIIIENDFQVAGQYEFVTDAFIKNGFELVYRRALGGSENFYQVWKKK